MKWRWLLALIPLILGAAISIWLNSSERAPLIRITVDLGTLIFILGVVISLSIVLILSTQLLTDRVRSQTVTEAGEDRRRFLLRLDHELKNPLTAILAGLANATAARNPDEYQPAVRSVTDQANRLRTLVTELRKLSDLESRELDKETVDMTGLLEEVYELAQDHPGAADRQLTLSIPRAPWPLPEIRGDRDLLFLAIYNPLDNALKFTQSGDTIELRAAEDDRSVVVEIADTGPGIPAEEISHVWEELYRGKRARTVPGSGLGLALVRAIVVRHGGQTAIRSRPGQGTLVTLRLPASSR
jgi:two-component system OmpR family sensor kinase